MPTNKFFARAKERVPRLPEAIWRRRVENEFNELKASGAVFAANADWTEYTLELRGKGLFFDRGAVKPTFDHKVLVRLLRDYPYAGGLEVVWLTPIFHPNIRSEDGRVCIQLLNAWSEGLSLSSLVRGLKQLLENPNPGDPLNKEAAKYFLERGSELGTTPPQPRPNKPRVVLQR